MVLKNSVLAPIFLHVTFPIAITLVDLGGCMPVHSPLWDPILSFSHTFSPKSAQVRGPCPPNGCMSPPWEILDLPLYYVCNEKLDISPRNFFPFHNAALLSYVQTCKYRSKVKKISFTCFCNIYHVHH